MIKALLCLLLMSQISRAYLVYDDDEYYIYRTPKMSYILTKSDFKHLPRLLGKTQQSMALYEKEFNWILDESTSLVVTSDKNQIANAFATVIPNNMAVFYKGGVEFLDVSATSSWIDTLSSHEIAHVYQLNAKNYLGSALKSVFGNQIYVEIPTIPLPVFISPNVLLPTFIVEGNAVLNESKLNQGGRLFSGEYVAMATELINNGQADLKFLMNSHLNFPFGSEKYILGGYFQASLANRYDFITINHFFKNHAENNINPFDLKSSFAATFFAEYENLYATFLEDFKERQKEYNPYLGSTLASSLQSIELSRIGETVFFLTNPDAKTRKNLNQYDFINRKLDSRPSTLTSGKIFKVNNVIVTAASFNQNNRNIFYTLLDDHDNFDERYANKYVTDIKGSYVSYFDMKDSFDTGSLYRNLEKIAETESKGLLDSGGNIYYFKQSGRFKHLYKNSQQISSVETNYAILSDVVSEDEIYFISNSKNGSSLFCFCQQKLKRVLPYDNVINAVKAGNGFVVVFQYGDSYRVASIDESLDRLESPYLTANQYPDKFFSSTSPPSDIKVSSSSERYLSVKEMRFSKYSLSYLSAKNHATVFNSINWIDPLFYSDLDAVFSLSNQLSYNGISYNYSPYATQFRFSFLNDTDFYGNDLQKITTNKYQVALSNSVYEKKFHSVTVGADFLSESNTLFRNEITSVYATYQYLESYFLNYLPYTYFSFSPSIEDSFGELSQSYQASLTKMLIKNLYLSMDAAKIDSEFYKLEANTGQRFFRKKGLFTPLFLNSYYSSKLTQGQAELLYDIPYSKYFYRFPISLRRVAPFLGYQKDRSEEYFYGTTVNEITFASIGVETELLLFHLNPVRVRLFSTELTLQESKTNSLNFLLTTNL